MLFEGERGAAVALYSFGSVDLNPRNGPLFRVDRRIEVTYGRTSKGGDAGAGRMEEIFKVIESATASSEA